MFTHVGGGGRYTPARNVTAGREGSCACHALALGSGYTCLTYLANRNQPLEGGSMPHGKICYLEIPANAAEASAEFYRTIFNWKIRKRGDGEIAFDDTGGVSRTRVKEAD